MNILFTGCTTGFGKRIKLGLEAQGHKIFGVGLQGPDFFYDFAKIGVEGHPDNWVESVYTQAEEALGPIDCLINNAGITAIDFTAQHELHNFQEVLFVNLTIPWMLSKGLVARACNLGYGEYPKRIINTSSMGATVALRGSPGYCASKAGLEAITKVMAKELAGTISPFIICAIAPGGVDDTGMQRYAEQELVRTRGFTPEKAAVYNRQSPLGRNMTHEEVWKIFDFAVNHIPEYMTGTILKCAGGMGI
jgi:3-oxoacyl-[acyl-carrier protein] reductase